jgi:hypothetical protein
MRPKTKGAEYLLLKYRQSFSVQYELSDESIAEGGTPKAPCPAPGRLLNPDVQTKGIGHDDEGGLGQKTL